MTVGSSRATTRAFTREVTPGEYVKPSDGAEFVPVRPGYEINNEPETLENDELLNDIGASKSAIGKEATSGSHPAYLRHSGVEGQEPQLGILYESIMGSKKIAATEYDTVSGSTAKVIKVGTGEGAQFVQGQTVLVKSSAGYEIRNIESISGDNLTLNFALKNVPGVGVNLGKAVTYLPASQGHPTVSVTDYLGGGFAKRASAGNTVTELSISGDAGAYAEVEFSFAGTKYFFNPIIIEATNKYLDVTDDTGTFAISVKEGVYRTPMDLAAALQVALEAANAETYTVNYSNLTGKFTIASGSTVLSLLWNTGANAANSIGSALGFSVAANDTGSTSYTSDNAQAYAQPVASEYDDVDVIIFKNAELMIGSADDNVCICAQSVAITISKTVEDVPCICEESGVSEKIVTAREVSMEISTSMKKYDASLVDAMVNNKGVSAMLNAGPKTGGNWTPGKCFNAFLQRATVNDYKPEGDSFIQASFTLKAYVTSTTKDIYLNFV